MTRSIVVLVPLLATAWTSVARADEPVCNRVLPKKVIPYYAGKLNPKSVCYAANAMAIDDKPAGLDYAIGSKLITVAGVKVAGCIVVEFQLDKQFVDATTLSSLTVTAKPHPAACAAAKSQCQGEFCGTGQSFVVFARGAKGRWAVAKSFEATTPNWSEYKIDTMNRYATDSLMVCRTATGPARDDIAIDGITGCAFKTGG